MSTGGSGVPGWDSGTAAYPMPGPGVPNPTRRPERRGWVTTGVIISVFLISLAVLSVFFGIDIGIGNSLVAAAVSAVPLLVVVPVFLWVDRMESEPVRYLIFAFLWGALCAAVGAIILNTGIHLIFLAAHTDNADAVTAVVSAPLVEETLKGAAILFIAWRRRREFDGVIDGIVYAGMAGAGFAFSENILYLGRAFAEAGTSGLTEVFFLRCLMGAVRAPAVHGVHGDRDRPGRDGGAIRGRSDRLRDVGLVVAMALHAIWNLSASVGAYLQVYLAFQMPIFAVFLVGLVLLRQREAGLVRRYLSQYADAGWFTRAEVEMLSSMGQRRSARAWARGLGGRAAVRSMRAFQDSASDLALLRARIVRGSAEPGAGAHERDLLDAVTANRGVVVGQVSPRDR
jgi:RsiW-degrading membrane proteinase PrsW (M82 family)